MKPLIDIHVHSYYSLLDGVSSPMKNVLTAKDMGATSLGISDHGVVSGIFDHYFACRDSGLKPILGCEMYLALSPNKSIYKGEFGDRTFDERYGYFHGIIMAYNEEGVKNLIRLSSIGGSHFKDKRPCITFEELFKHNTGLLYSTGCMLGITGASHKMRDILADANGSPAIEDGEFLYGPWRYGSLPLELSESLYQQFIQCFGKDRIFVEIGPAKVDHDFSKIDEGVSKDGKKVIKWGFVRREDPEEVCLQIKHNKRALLLAKKYGLKTIVSSDAHMCNPELKEVQDILIQTSPGNSNGWHFHQVHAMMSSKDAWEMFQINHPYIDQKMFEEFIENTHVLDSMVEDIRLKFPTQIPKFKVGDALTPRQYMMKMIKDIGRLPSNDIRYLKRLKEEMDVICDNGIVDYTDYFLILADIVQAAKRLGVGVGPARGSAGGCLLSYLLGITSIDPVKFNLSFARFLTIGRLKKGNPPDIDMDFTNRDPIVQYIFEKYGREHVAMVGAHQTIKTKAALKDITRALNGGHLDHDHIIHAICKTIDNAPQYYPSERDFLYGFEDDDLNKHPGLYDSNSGLRKYLEQNPKVKRILDQILETPRHLSKHAGGIVITPGPIDESIPTINWQGEKCTQIGFKMLEKIGGMKIDILGVNTLNFIWEAVKKIKERHGIDIDPWNLPEDPATFSMISAGETTTVFQFDTPVVRPFLLRIKPKTIYDLTLITSVARPGCLDSTLEGGKSVAEHFILRKTGKEKAVLADPLLEPIVGHTFNLFIFQEQIQKVFEVVGGLTPSESDDARRAVGKKNLQVLLSIKKQLFENAIKRHGWTLDKCQQLWDSFIGAANYAFNEAHATAYAITAYACAYLKKNYPAEWWCSVLSYIESDRIKGYLSEIQDKLRYPDINSPGTVWSLDEDNNLIPPLTLIRAVGENAALEVQNKAPFSSFDDFYGRIDRRKVNKSAILNLIVAGCFTKLEGENREEEIIQRFFKLRKEKTIPEEYKNLDRPAVIKKKSQLLSIASYNFIDEFYDIVKSGTNCRDNWTYEKRGNRHLIDGAVVVENVDTDFDELHKKNFKGTVAFVGLVTAESKLSYYNDKKTGLKKPYFKLYVENSNRVVDTVIWSDDLKDIDKDDFKEGTLLVVFGKVQYSGYKKMLELQYISHKKML